MRFILPAHPVLAPTPAPGHAGSALAHESTAGMPAQRATHSVPRVPNSPPGCSSSDMRPYIHVPPHQTYTRLHHAACWAPETSDSHPGPCPAARYWDQESRRHFYVGTWARRRWRCTRDRGSSHPLVLRRQGQGTHVCSGPGCLLDGHLSSGFHQKKPEVWVFLSTHPMRGKAQTEMLG